MQDNFFQDFQSTLFHFKAGRINLCKSRNFSLSFRPHWYVSVRIWSNPCHNYQKHFHWIQQAQGQDLNLCFASICTYIYIYKHHAIQYYNYFSDMEWSKHYTWITAKGWGFLITFKNFFLLWDPTINHSYLCNNTDFHLTNLLSSSIQKENLQSGWLNKPLSVKAHTA